MRKISRPAKLDEGLDRFQFQVAVRRNSVRKKVSKRLKLAKFYYVLIMAEFADFFLHLFDVSDFQVESSARFPEIEATDY